MFDYKIQATKTGLKVVLASLPHTSATTILVMIKTGSRYEKKSLNGISHFLEHMFFKGSKDYPSAFKLASALDAIGAEYNAFTSKEYTGFWIKSASNHLNTLVKILANMLQEPLLSAQEIEREKDVVLEEMNMYQDTPMSYVNDLFENLLYGNTAHGRLIIGSKETVLGITKDKLKNYLNKQYNLKNTIVFVSGPANGRTVLNKIDKYFNRVKEARSLPKLAINLKQTRPRLKVFSKATDQTHLKLGFPGLSAKDKDVYVLGVLAVILGGNMSSRLFIKIRERLGLAYYISASVESYSDTGYFAVRAGLNHGKLLPAIEAILTEFKTIKIKGVSDAELNRAKEYLKGKLLLNLETSNAIAFWLAEQMVVRDKIMSINETLERVDSVTSQQIQDLAKRILRGSKINLALIGPYNKPQEFKTILNKYKSEF